jgi:hypothetical protein
MESSIKNEVILLYWREPEVSQLNAAKIVEFMGAKARLVDLTQFTLNRGEPAQSALAASPCMIVSADTLAQAVKQSHIWAPAKLINLAANLLIYGFTTTPEHSRIAREITDGGFSGVEGLRKGDTRFSVEGPRELCRHFAGLYINSANPSFDLAFVEGSNQLKVSSVICVEEKPFFASLTPPGSRVLLLACGEIADMDELVPKEVPIAGYFSRLAPLMMFLTQALGKKLWHNDAPRACFIVDDPLLRPRYGFLDYEQLLNAMERHRFSASIAFIPWNHWRSKQGTVGLFKSRSQRLSLCVHGCDHTFREFGTTHYPALWARARRGLDRMRRHEQRTGLAFDEVMVFPQGHFSTAAVRALQSCGFLAAVNSTPYPTDAPNALRLKDLLDVAVTNFSNFPLFTRRYPGDKVGLAFDLFVGKNALLVGHHRFFRNGYDVLTEIVNWLNSVEERLEWTSLSGVCRQACLKRESDNGEIHIRLYTDNFVIRNDSDRRQNYILSRRQLAEAPCPIVTLNGCRVESRPSADMLDIPLELGLGQKAEVRIERATSDKPAAQAGSQPVRVFVRRLLSEFRDNHIDKNAFLSQLADGVRNRLVGKK